jgi:hypothetical protein
MSRLKYLLVVIALVSWVAVQSLCFISRYADWPLLYISGSCWLALVVFALWAVLGRRWRELAVFLSTAIIIALPGLGVPQLADWIQQAGFRLYASPLESYLSGCKLFDFIDDDGSKQQVGQCRSIPQAFNSRLTVIYDTTGQFALPVERRTRAWKWTVSWHLSPGAFFADRNHDDAHIFGNFYSVLTTLNQEEGKDVE